MVDGVAHKLRVELFAIFSSLHSVHRVTSFLFILGAILFLYIPENAVERDIFWERGFVRELTL